MAQQIIYRDVVPIAWDVVAPIEGSVITYEVLRAPEGTPNLFKIVGETDELFYNVPLIIEGDWIIGVRTIRTITENGERLLSEINWSDINGINTPSPFIARYFELPGMPTNMRLR